MVADYIRTGNSALVRTADQVLIPFDPNNADYKEYLAYVAAGGITDSLNYTFTDGSNANTYFNGNVLINTDFRISQRTKPGSAAIYNSSSIYPNNDDAFTLDRWYILSDGNNRVIVSRDTTNVEQDMPACCKLEVVTTSATGFKFGIAQMVENSNCAGLIDNTVTLSFKARVSSTTKLSNVKAAVVEWTGTSNSVTSDIVSAWGVAGTSPTLIASAAYVTTPVNLQVGTTWGTYVLTGTVSASCKNLIVFIWSDVKDTTAGDFINIGDVTLEAGGAPTGYKRELGVSILDQCHRYFYPVWARASGHPYRFVTVITDTRLDGILDFPQEMFRVPTVSNSAASTFRIVYTGTTATITSVGNLVTTPVNWSFSLGYSPGGLIPGYSAYFTDNNVNTSYIHFNGEM
jgi:hypothetical protein